jgi:hypothetical protein
MVFLARILLFYSLPHTHLTPYHLPKLQAASVAPNRLLQLANLKRSLPLQFFAPRTCCMRVRNSWGKRAAGELLVCNEFGQEKYDS